MPTFQPRYREAYPLFDVVKANAALARERPVCEFSSETGSPRGSLLVTAVDGDRLEFEFELFAEYFSGAGRIELSLVPAPIRANPLRYLVICPSCQQQVVTLFFVDRWRCGSCHHLGFRSQHVSRPVRERERRFERWKHLDQLLIKGKPHRMRQATVDRLLRERDALHRWLLREPRYRSSERHVPRIRAKWIELAEARQWNSVPHVPA